MKVSTLVEILCLSEELNYTEAARRLFMSQSVLSRHIVDLETEIGCQLFLRNKRSVELTNAGKVLANRARSLISFYDETIAEVRMESLRCGSSIKVGYFHSASFSILAVGKRLFKSIHPDIEMSVKSLYPQDLRDALDSDELDIIISLPH